MGAPQYASNCVGGHLNILLDSVGEPLNILVILSRREEPWYTSYSVGERRNTLVTRGLRRGRLTPACGSAHARNGRGCRQI